MVAASWILCIIAGLALLLALDFKLGRRQHLGRIKKLSFPARYSGLEIFHDGPDLFKDYFTELKKAERHIHIHFYIVKDDDFSKKFFSILSEKAANGVEVRLMVDWVGTKLSRQSIKELKSSGIEFAYSRKPSFPFYFYTLQVRNHRKITIIDGKKGYTGGFNVGKEYIDKDKKLSPWRDYHLKVQGEGVADLQQLFLLDWRAAAKTDLLGSSVYFPALEKGPFKMQFIPSEGNKLEGMMINLIQKAERTIFIGTPYFIPSQKLFRVLLEAIKRGVTVKLLVPSIADHFLVQEASYPYLRQMLRAGAEICQFKTGFYHAKVLQVDNEICDIGTANFDKRSLFLNLELNCLIFDEEFIKRIDQVIEQDIADSSTLQLEKLNRFNPGRILKEQIAKTISYFL